MPDEPQDPQKTEERSEQQRAAESLRQQATEKVQGETNAVRYGVYAYTWGPECAQGGQQMTYPTMPPWCSGQPLTFPPICPPAGGAGGGGGGAVGAPTPTATFPPVCGDPAQAAAQMPTIYPAYTCGFVCNTLYPPCGPQQAQVGFAPRDISTISGSTCPKLQCGGGGIQTLNGPTCPPNACIPPTSVGFTCPIQFCQPTVAGYTCPIQNCWGAPDPPTWSGRTCPVQLCDPSGFEPDFGQVAAQAPMGGGIQPTLTANTCLAVACQPTLFQVTCPVCPPTLVGNTCPIPVCHPTLVGNTCPRPQCPPPTFSGHTCAILACRPTLFNRTCPQQLCRPTLNPICVIQPPILQPGPQQQQQVGFRGGVQTVVGRTCPFFECQTTLWGGTCPEDVCPIPTVMEPQCFPTLPGEICQAPAGGGGGQVGGIGPVNTLNSPGCVIQPVTVSGPNCLNPVTLGAQNCFVTLSGQTCLFVCKPTLFGKTCPPVQCFHTLWGTTCVCQWPVNPPIPQPAQPAAAGQVGAPAWGDARRAVFTMGNNYCPTLFSHTCIVWQCHPTLQPWPCPPPVLTLSGPNCRFF